jgi:hypothetical protein
VSAERIRKHQRIRVSRQAACLHVTYENHVHIWEDLIELRKGKIAEIVYQARPQVVKFRRGDDIVAIDGTDTAVVAFDAYTLDSVIIMVETILHGRRVDADHYDFQLSQGDFTISFDSELYCFGRQNMDREAEFTPYAQPWDKIVK